MGRRLSIGVILCFEKGVKVADWIKGVLEIDGMDYYIVTGKHMQAM